MAEKSRSWFPSWFPRPIVTEFTKDVPRRRALDLGAGAGKESLYLATLGFSVDAVDERDLSGLTRKAKLDRLPLRTWRMNFLDFDMGMERFHLIVALYSLQERQNDGAFPILIHWIQQALVPGGRFILGLITRNLEIRPGLTDDDVRARPPEFHLHTLEDLKLLFPGFAIVYERDYVAWDWEGQPGMEYPHAHTVLDLVADKSR